MNKQELIGVVATMTGNNATATGEVVDAILQIVMAAMVRGDTVQLTGFGLFSTGTRSERVGRNPSTGEAMTIAASKTVRFKPAKRFKDAVNAR
ncbi:HU family DNA-binding protein (plasmid) [Paraburkholderia sp. PREW-6R]|uniref:HU family DNA-binding protein n=1 Tax=Paraburkholderia sp. PREW-6R TaxID=3141544 RepID=UPI0031F53CED